MAFERKGKPQYVRNHYNYRSYSGLREYAFGCGVRHHVCGRRNDKACDSQQEQHANCLRDGHIEVLFYA